MENNVEIRKRLVHSCKRIVIKAGTRLLTDPEEVEEFLDAMVDFKCAQLTKLKVTKVQATSRAKKAAAAEAEAPAAE